MSEIKISNTGDKTTIDVICSPLAVRILRKGIIKSKQEKKKKDKKRMRGDEFIGLQYFIQRLSIFFHLQHNNFFVMNPHTEIWCNVVHTRSPVVISLLLVFAMEMFDYTGRLGKKYFLSLNLFIHDKVDCGVQNCSYVHSFYKHRGP